VTGVAALLFVLVALAGCATRLVPAPDAIPVPGGAGGAVAEVAGVRVIARASAWRGVPSDLAREVTPVLITMDNRSTVPLRVRYEQFTLDGVGGQRFDAVAPFDITGLGTELVPAASIGPRSGASWVIGGPFRHGLGYAPFLYEPFAYDPFYSSYLRREIALPTGDMVQKALPETVIEPGGRATGFVYFERVSDVQRVVFRAELVDARTGERFAIASIPFVTE
jgi:hypothetical protein